MTEVGLMETARILVVEDEAIVSADIEMKLEHLGYTVAGVATSGALALEKAQEVQPNLALMDIRLDGGMDGVETAQALKDRFRIPVIYFYLTAYADPATLDRAKVTQPYGYIAKPFGERDLQISIEMARYRNQAERQRRENERQNTLSTTVSALVQRRIDLDTAIQVLERLQSGVSGVRKRGRPRGSKNRG
jgi:CheY-like chemotaxis protein